MKDEAIGAPRTRVHETAVVEGDVRLEPGCFVDAGAVLRGPLAFGRDTRIDALAVVEGPATFGAANRIHPLAVLGGAPQDRTHGGEPTLLAAGDRNVFREHVTVHRGTRKGGGATRIGHGNLFMVGTHVAHDCVVGDDVQMANGVTLAGHVHVGNQAVFGGQAAVGPFVRVGELAMVAAGAMLDRDAPPFCIVRGDRAVVAALNVVGLRRRRVPRESIAALRAAFRIVFTERRMFVRAVEECARLGRSDPYVARLAAFLGESRLGVRRA